MVNFKFSVPTTIYFGRGQISNLSKLAQSGNKVLLTYGGGSIKSNGIYDTAMAIMKDAGLEVFELPGVEPNPKIETVRKGVDMCKAEGIQMVLAIGGGSTIDCAKVIACGACYEGDPWDLVIKPGLIKGALPIYSVLTLSATGSEMDAVAVISDMSKNEKWGTASPFMAPTMSIMDPEYTFSVSKRQTASGTADIMSHTLESYFNFVEGAELQTQFAEGLLRTIIKYGPIALEEPDNYEARANLMWASSHAINGLLSSGCYVKWCVHPMEHELSAFYDITHGEGLAILTPRIMEYVLDRECDGAAAEGPTKEEITKLFARFGRNVYDLSGTDEETARGAIEATKDFFFNKLGIPATLAEVGITDEEHFDIMAEKALKGCVNTFVPFTKEDILAIFRASK